MKLARFLPLGLASVLIISASVAEGAVSLVNITGIRGSGYNGANGDTTYTGRVGKLSQFQQGAIGGTGANQGITQTDPDNPSTWIHGSNWQEGWQAGKVGGTNIGWVVLDFGASTTNLGDLLLWNVTEAGAGAQSRGVSSFNIWYYDSPLGVIAEGAYDFDANGWTQLGTTNDLAIGGTTGALTGTFSLSGITARYVAIEILDNHGSSTTGVDTTNRVGLAEIVVTQIPEPGTALITGFAGLALLRRRRVS